MNEVDRDLKLWPHSHLDFDQQGEADYYVAGLPRRMGMGSIILVPARIEYSIKLLFGWILKLASSCRPGLTTFLDDGF